MRRSFTVPIVATLGFLFLYAPIIALVIFSFNANRLVTVWSGFSLASYSSLWGDPQLLPAAERRSDVLGRHADGKVLRGTVLAARPKN